MQRVGPIRLNARSRIGIIGSGLAGLTCANALVRLGFRNVWLFEQCPELKDTAGYESAIVLPPNGANVLRRLGIAEVDSQASPLQLWDSHHARYGLHLHSFDLTLQGKSPRGGLVMKRGDLLQAMIGRLQKALPENHVRFGYRLRNLRFVAKDPNNAPSEDADDEELLASAVVEASFLRATQSEETQSAETQGQKEKEKEATGEGTGDEEEGEDEEQEAAEIEIEHLDLLVGADGFHSITRAVLFKDEIEAGQRLLEASAAMMTQRKNAVFTFPDGRHEFYLNGWYAQGTCKLSALGGSVPDHSRSTLRQLQCQHIRFESAFLHEDSLCWFAFFPEKLIPESLYPRSAVPGLLESPVPQLQLPQDFVAKLFESDVWPAYAARAVQQTAPARFQAQPLRGLIPQKDQLFFGRVALLGDAVHAMPPDAHQDDAMTVEGGTVLALCLASQPLTEALKLYASLCSERSENLCAWSSKQCQQHMQTTFASELFRIAVDSLFKKVNRPSRGISDQLLAQHDCFEFFKGCPI